MGANERRATTITTYPLVFYYPIGVIGRNARDTKGRENFVEKENGIEMKWKSHIL